MWTIFKVFIKFVTLLLLFYALLFGHEACGSLPSQPGLEPAPPALEGEVLTTELSGKSHTFSSIETVLNYLALDKISTSENVLCLSGFS